MSYVEAKHERDRALVESLHGDGIVTGIPVTAPIVVSQYGRRPSPQYAAEPREIGWGQAVEFDVGQLFPDLVRGD